MYTKFIISKSFAALAFCALAFGVTGMLPSAACASGAAKVAVCHIPPDDPLNFHSITISSKALPAHLSHLDLSGSCDRNCAALCNDGDACTIDDTADCETAGCPVVKLPVDCNDGNACTTDACDPIHGCASVPVVCEAVDACHVATCDPLGDGECEQLPIECPDGYICDAELGCVPDTPAPPPDACPCFTLAELQAENPVRRAPDAIAVGIFQWFSNYSAACSGSNGCATSGGVAVRACYLRTGYNGIVPPTQNSHLSWLYTELETFITVAEDTACQNLINWNYTYGQAPAAAARASSSAVVLPEPEPIEIGN